MKTIAVLLLFAASGYAQTSARPQPGTSQNSTPSGPAIPADAALVEPYLYRVVDSNGKVWMYRQTPFGVVKWEVKAETSLPADGLFSVTDLGDSVRFERTTPFGVTRWIRKKTDLSGDEKASLAREQTPPINATAEKP